MSNTESMSAHFNADTMTRLNMYDLGMLALAPDIVVQLRASSEAKFVVARRAVMAAELIGVAPEIASMPSTISTDIRDIGPEAYYSVRRKLRATGHM